MTLGSAKSQVPKLIIREIILEYHNPPTLQTDRRTVGRTDGQLIMAIPSYATLRTVLHV